MKRILVHIGTGKTGSTSIQEALFAAQIEGRLTGAVYPIIEGAGNHQNIISLYKPHRSLPRGVKSRYPTDNEAFRRSVTATRDGYLEALGSSDRVILSAEFLSSLNAGQVRQFALDLKACGFMKPRVLVYVREPSAYYLSLVQQQLKAASSFTEPAAFRYGIEKLVSDWQAAFPQGVNVRPFDRQLLTGGCVVQDFVEVASEYLGADLGGLRAKSVRSNESISAEAMVVLQRYRSLFYPNEDNVFKTDSTRLVDCLQQSTAWLAQTRPRLKSGVARLIVNNHVADLEFLRSSYRISFQTNSAEDDPTYDHDMRERVEDILEEVDPAIVDKLLLGLIRKLVM